MCTSKMQRGRDAVRKLKKNNKKIKNFQKKKAFRFSKKPVLDNLNICLSNRILFSNFYSQRRNLKHSETS